MAQILIDAGADVNTPNKLGQRPLQLAINDVDLVRILLDSNAETAIYAENHFNMSPLEESLYNQRVDVANLLVEHGAPVDLRIEAGLGKYDAICERIGQHGSFRYASVGLPHQPGPKLSSNDGLRQALAYAVRNGQIETIELLIDEGAPVNDLVPHIGRIGTPLHHAVEANQLEAAQVLTKHNAKIDIADDTEHLTPLDLAKRLNASEIASHLNKLAHS